MLNSLSLLNSLQFNRGAWITHSPLHCSGETSLRRENAPLSWIPLLNNLSSTNFPIMQPGGRERPLPSILQQGDVDGDSPILLNPSPRRRRRRLELSPICQLDGDDSQPGPLSMEQVTNEISTEEYNYICEKLTNH